MSILLNEEGLEGVFNHLPSFNRTLCTYTNIQILLKNKNMTKMERCQHIGQGICNNPSLFINPFSLYFCHTNESKYILYGISLASIFVILLAMDQIRKKYILRPIMKIRRFTGIRESIVEYVIIPFAQGMTPLVLRLQASLQGVNFDFQVGGALGGMLALNCFGLGLCAIALGYSRKTDTGKFGVSFCSMMVGLILIASMCLDQEVNMTHGFIFLGLWLCQIVFHGLRNIEEYRSKRFKILDFGLF